MNEVSSKVIELYKSVTAHLDRAPLFADLSFTETDYPSRISWAEFCVLTSRLESMLGGPDALRRVGKAIFDNPAFLMENAIFRLVASPRFLYYGSCRWGARAMFSCATDTFRDLDQNRVEVTIDIPDRYQDCPGFFHINLGFFEAMPKMMGLSESVVTREISARQCIYTIEMPPSLTIWARIKRAWGALFSARIVFNAMAHQQEELAQKYDDLKLAHQKIEEEHQAALIARDVAENALTVKTQFLATMSHEIRTPLNGIIGMSELLQNTSMNATQSDYTQTIRTSSKTLLSLINDILDYSKIDADRIEFEQIDFSIQTILDEVGHVLGEQALQKGLQLDCVASPTTPACLRGDPNRIRQILFNLVGNAIKFTQSGKITVTAELEPGPPPGTQCEVRFSIQDTGIGISRKQQAKLFEPFKQANSSTSRKYGGTGLGLAICRGIVTAIGGQIGMTSQEGEGSTFWFTIPLEKRTSVTTKQAQNTDLSGLTALVLDDNATNRTILEKHLGEHKLNVQSASNGADLLTLLDKTKNCDLILLDMHLPGMDGIAVAKQIRSIPKYQHIPLIMLSSMLSSDDSNEAQEAGIARYLTKPIQKSELLLCIASLFGDRFIQPISDKDTSTDKDTAQKTVALPPPVPVPSHSRGRVLVAEDNAINQKVIVSMLETLQYDVVVVNNGQKAIDAVRVDAFDLVLMDCHMPVLDGFDASVEIRDLKNHPAIPIIAVTADVMPGTRERCLRAGMNDYINKPVTLQTLEHVLNQWMHVRASA